MPNHDALQTLLKQQRRRVVAHLARSLGLSHLALAEEAVQTAALRALEVWPAQDVPANPAGWLYRVARHDAIDALRVAGRHDTWPDDDDDAAQAALLRVQPPPGRLSGELDDDELALLFCACHPRLPVAAQVALAMRALAGLDLNTIAAGLLCTEAALAQRLARARASLKPEDLRLPAGRELPARREAVLTTLSLAFHASARARARGRTRGSARRRQHRLAGHRPPLRHIAAPGPHGRAAAGPRHSQSRSGRASASPAAAAGAASRTAAGLAGPRPGGAGART